MKEEWENKRVDDDEIELTLKKRERHFIQAGTIGGMMMTKSN